jgi:excinuclease UvrABC nuclease subunit
LIIKHFGSVSALRQADSAALQLVPGIGPALAAAIFDTLHPPESDGE